jgi:serine/threonine-protein kinase
MTGRTIGKYRIGDQIGRGGMGTVYRATDETLHREVAIKAIHADILTPESLERFRAEAITLAKLTHPRIATIHELTPDGQTLLMVMEYISGETCEKLIARAGPLPVPRAITLCDQVLDALQHAHAAGIVHRDLKPANVMVTGSGEVKVMDFGIARAAGSQHLTLDGYVVGTPAYMSPEQVQGAEVDPRMDLYAVSVILYQLVTRRLPFEADTPLGVMHAKLSGPPTPPRQYRTDLPDWIDAVLKRGLANAPIDRFQTAAEYRRALEAGSSGGFAAAIHAEDEVATIAPTPSPSSVRASSPKIAVTPDAVQTPSTRVEQTVTLRAHRTWPRRAPCWPCW